MKHTAGLKKEELGVKKNPTTSNQVKTQINNARNNEGKTMKSLQELERKLARKEEELDQIGHALEDRNNDFQQLEVDAQKLETETVLSKIKKSTDVLRIAALQKRYKKLDEISNKTAKLMFQ